MAIGTRTHQGQNIDVIRDAALTRARWAEIVLARSAHQLNDHPELAEASKRYKLASFAAADAQEALTTNRRYPPLDDFA